MKMNSKMTLYQKLGIAIKTFSKKVKGDAHSTKFKVTPKKRYRFVLVIVWSVFSRISKKVQVGKDQEKAQSEKDSHSKNRGGKKTN